MLFDVDPAIRMAALRLGEPPGVFEVT